MSTTTDLNTFKINYLTQAQYETALSGGLINENELYLTPDISGTGTSVTLATSSWSNKTQTVTASGVTANNNIIISPAPASMNNYSDALIKCTGQGSNSLTFTCETVPSSAITVNILILN